MLRKMSHALENVSCFGKCVMLWKMSHVLENVSCLGGSTQVVEKLKAGAAQDSYISPLLTADGF